MQLFFNYLAVTLIALMMVGAVILFPFIRVTKAALLFLAVWLPFAFLVAAAFYRRLKEVKAKSYKIPGRRRYFSHSDKRILPNRKKRRIKVKGEN